MSRIDQVSLLLIGSIELRLYMLVGDSYNLQPTWKRDLRRALQILERDNIAIEYVKK